MVLRQNTIELNNIKEEDKIIKNIKGSTLSIQVDGSGTLSLKGRHYESDQTYDLGLINMTTLSKTTAVSSPGIYLAILEGIDEITLDLGGSGNVSWKEIGD